ncbi:nickel pincer cofactor biosynthesis protein LarB [Enterorhabdus sp. P55]|uniref:nickel pincer cofactor biosynthesis protein LarB n=1 Tax=Enterorhabdus sp. P55 TaxID=2304571 RepID=UPI00351AF521
MDEAGLRALLAAVAAGEASVEEALARCKTAPFADLGYAKVDTHRGVRQGVAEVVYGEGKTAAQIAGICQALVASGQPRVLITRLDDGKAAAVADALSGGAAGGGGAVRDASEAGAPAALGALVPAPALAASVDGPAPALALTYFAEARLGVVGGMPEPDGVGEIVVAAAGTSDVPVAEEAALTAEFLGNRVTRLYDVGVAGVHRLLAQADVLARARVVVAVAGMEGALASVVGGLVSCPVIAVPTSVGYGASFGGMTALLAMLNSCASGVSVVNIDNGFGAAYQASLINHLR